MMGLPNDDTRHSQPVADAIDGARAEVVQTAIAPFTVPAPVVLTLTAHRAAFVLPASRLVMLPLPLMRLDPVPLVAPKRAFRSSTKPAAPVALLVMLSTWLTLCPTCTGCRSSAPRC